MLNAATFSNFLLLVCGANIDSETYSTSLDSWTFPA